MTRGDIVTVAGGEGVAGKPRPALIIQADKYHHLSTIILALISSNPEAAQIDLNVALSPSSTNNLRLASWIMVHSLSSIRTVKLGPKIGEIAAAELEQVDNAVLIILGLA